ncbi:uncharacterized protein PITG_00382 [Phytophthora infestans T30-4]|uniref:Endonuclease-reverse transcriptase n=1 Tax=Phytophthora infestans (strain T30-4) TaxID=403677 RepID=D0MQN1_PHYIT|nr:uncharacterized protein PITG_00382 [Phytophthora infestans T30-4]EEY57800.1 hypothetical protein PITG_00382 [Phytophthora infestans T30-4]|eukprot:XP_002908986.1 hypothetical protein PITG_00382 [Phytophthora infestans T30-4]
MNVFKTEITQIHLARRKTLAAAALRRLWTIWLRSQISTDATRIRLYNCYVLPILLYNCGTWALTTSELLHLESFHRRQLRKRTTLRHRITAARWGLFGHILRRPDIPASVQMQAYFAPSTAGKWRDRPRTTLPLVLDADLLANSTYADTTLCRRLAKLSLAQA